MFSIAAGVYVFGNTVFVIFGKASVQPFDDCSIIGSASAAAAAKKNPIIPLSHKPDRSSSSNIST